MKNVLKISLLGFGIAMSIISCDQPKTATKAVNTEKIDSPKAEVTTVKVDTAHADTLQKVKVK